MKRTILIDGDVEAFRAASVSQENIPWDADSVSMNVNPKGAEDYLVSALTHYQSTLKADDMIVCLTHEENWRKKLWPDYKANRKDKPRPLLLAHCREFLANNYRVECWPRLEADDVLGILSTSIDGSVIVSVDKDMKTIPCRLYNPDHPEAGVVQISPVDAFLFHMTQALTGDTTDGYPGCPQIGKVKAARILHAVTAEWTSDGSTWDALFDFNKGKVDIWNSVVNTYEAAGLKPKDALVQARLAYILRLPEEYNKKTQKMRLWQAPL